MPISLRERAQHLRKALDLSTPTRERSLRLRLAAGWTLTSVRAPHATLQVDLRDIGIGRPLYRQGFYEPGETAALQRLTPAGGVVLDIGANLGYYTTLFAQRAERVFAVEPNPATVALLAANTQTMPNVVILPVLVGDTDREAALYLSPEGNAGDHQAIAHPDRQAIPISMRTLDSLAAQHDIRRVDLFKLDIQGYEVFALRGAARLLAENPHAPIVAEFWPLGLRDAGLTVDDWLACFDGARFCRIADDGSEIETSVDWFHQQPISHYESLVIRRSGDAASG